MEKSFLEGLGLAPEIVSAILAVDGAQSGQKQAQPQVQQQPQIQAQHQPQAQAPAGVPQEEYDRIVAELEQLKVSGMTEEERLNLEVEKANKAEAKYRTELARLKVERIFIEAGLSEDEYAPLVSSVATADEKLSIALAEQIAGTVKAKVEATDKSVREQLMKDTPSVPGVGASSDSDGGDKSLGAQFAKAYGAKFNKGADGNGN